MASVAIRPNLWHNWTRITTRAEARALEARRTGLATHEFTEHLAEETHETMVAVSAARSALTHLEADWKDLGFFEGIPRDQIPIEATSDPPDDVDAWLADIKLLIDDRIEIEHIPQPSTTAVPHPAYPTSVSAIDAYFVAERATAAVDLLLDFYHRVIDSPSDRLAQWAAKRSHLPDSLDEIRRRS